MGPGPRADNVARAKRQTILVGLGRWARPGLEGGVTAARSQGTRKAYLGAFPRSYRASLGKSWHGKPVDVSFGLTCHNEVQSSSQCFQSTLRVFAG